MQAVGGQRERATVGNGDESAQAGDVHGSLADDCGKTDILLFYTNHKKDEFVLSNAAP
jgi:hypothetical protein